MAWRKSPPELIAAFDVVVPADPAIERRKMFGYPAAFLNGRMFAGLYRDTVVMKLSEGDWALMARDFGARPFEPMPGRRMGEFMETPAAILSDRNALKEWIARSAAYVATLPAKSAQPKTKPKARVRRPTST